jgi:endonuclease-3
MSARQDYPIMDKNNILNTLEILEKTYPDARTALNYRSPFELLVAVILSAQCTDKRVNAVPAELFKKYNTPQAFASVPQKELEALIKPCGFYHNKAKHIINSSLTIMEKYGGQVPQNFEELITLDGVGRKTANIILSVAFNKNAIAVDTHVFRTANRIGLSHADNVFDTEMQLMQNIPENLWSRAHHLLIFHGRNICRPKPKCQVCPIMEYCDYYQNSRNGCINK